MPEMELAVLVRQCTGWPEKGDLSVLMQQGVGKGKTAIAKSDFPSSRVI